MKNRDEYETLLCERDVLGDKKRRAYERRGRAASEDRGSAGVVGKWSWESIRSLHSRYARQGTAYENFAKHVERQEE